MASLYDIDRSIMECVDMETGEIIDPGKLESLQMERRENIATSSRATRASAKRTQNLPLRTTNSKRNARSSKRMPGTALLPPTSTPL